MKKTEKLSILISIVLISLLAISAVSAANTDDTTISETSTDDVISEPTTNDVVSEPSTKDVQIKDTQDKTTTKEASSPTLVKEEPTTDGNFTELSKNIRSDFDAGKTTINLTKNYTYVEGDDINGIELTSSLWGGNNLTIDGKGFTLNANNKASVFQIKNGMNVILENLRIINARESFAAITVTNDSSLTLKNVTFFNNPGGAITTTDCPVIVNGSRFIRSGNAINSEFTEVEKYFDFDDGLKNAFEFLEKATVVIANSTFGGNENSVSVTNNLLFVINSTFRGDHGLTTIYGNNSAIIIVDSQFEKVGGAIYLNNSGLGMANSKFINASLNSKEEESWAAIYANNSGIGMGGVEFINNTGDALKAFNSFIVAYDSNFTNTSDDGIVAFNSTVSIYDGLFENNDEAICSISSILFVNGTDFISNGHDDLDAAIAASNSTIDIVNSTFIDNPGAIELYNGNLTISDFTRFINNTENAAILAAFANVSITEALFANNTAGAIQLYNGTLDITDGIYPVLFINSTDDNAIEAVLANITINGALFENNSAAIDLDDGNLYVNDAWFINNTYGAIYAENANVTIIGAYFKGNGNEESDGGAIYQVYGELIITADSEFINNTADFGGAIYIENVNATIWADFINNTANQGGAIYIENSADEEVEIIGEFINNTATRAGAIRNTGNTTIYGIFTNNTATAKAGGAILNENNGNATITGTFTNNKATANGAYGGAIYNFGGYATISGEFTNNIARANGGAIGTLDNGQDPTTIVYESIFTNNIATQGGAIYNTGFMNITDSKFNNNNATDNGGAIYNTNTAEKSMLIKDTTFKNDYAPSGASQAREIYTAHADGDWNEDHTMIITLNGVTITNTFNNKEDYGSAPNIFCDGCVNKIDVKEYDVNVILNFTILNNVKDKVVLYITLVDEEGNLIDSAWKYVEWNDDFGEHQDKWVELPIFNITGDITTTNVNNSVPYITTLPIGQRTINITYGSDGGYGPRFAFVTETFTFNVTQTVENLTAQIEDLEKQKAKLEENITKLQGQIADLEKQIEEKDGNISALQTQVNILKGNLTAMETILNDTKAQLAAANADLTSTKATLNDVQGQLKNTQTQLTNTQNQLSSANTKNANSNAKFKKVKANKKQKRTKTYKIKVTLSKKTKQYVFLFFDKTYRKKTNSKGQVTFKVSSKVLKKLLGNKKTRKFKFKLVFNQKMKSMTDRQYLFCLRLCLHLY